MRRFYALLCMMVLAISVYGFTVDGINYSEDSYYGGVQVKGLEDKSYSGQLVIPETVTYSSFASYESNVRMRPERQTELAKLE